jgi:hypothetical protein
VLFRSKVPESFKVLIKELQSLALNVIAVGAQVYNDQAEVKEEVEAEKVKEEVKELQESLDAESVVDNTAAASEQGVEIADTEVQTEGGVV